MKKRKDSFEKAEAMALKLIGMLTDNLEASVKIESLLIATMRMHIQIIKKGGDADKHQRLFDEAAVKIKENREDFDRKEARLIKAYQMLNDLRVQNGLPPASNAPFCFPKQEVTV